jgi:hypothetical protein
MQGEAEHITIPAFSMHVPAKKNEEDGNGGGDGDGS